MGPSAREIVELNIRHSLAPLKTETDPVKRKSIKRPLAEQQPMLDALVKKEGG